METYYNPLYQIVCDYMNCLFLANNLSAQINIMRPDSCVHVRGVWVSGCVSFYVQALVVAHD